MMDKDPERLRFEQWYDAQKDGRLEPWDVWQAARADAVAQGHACMYALDHGGHLYRRYKEVKCPQPREPMDPLDIEELFDHAAGADEETHVRFARLVERHHGIGA